MLRRKCSILLLFGMTLAPITFINAQLGQITSVISIASKYATLLKSNQNDVIYADENLKDEIDEHVKIAIIPFNTAISYIKPPQYTEEIAEQQFENQQMIGKLLQEQFWDVFDNYKSEIYLQDIRITNKILQDIGYFLHPGDYPPSYLAKLLNVDAVLICTYDLEVDNQKTGWENLSKALSDLAMSQLKGNIPGLQALKFIKNPNALIDVITKPGEFYQKLKSGDIAAITNIAGSLLPEGNWQKVAEVAAKNSKTITKLAKGDTSNLFSDLVSNNASLLGNQLKLNPQVVKLIQNNSKVVQNVIDGNTKGIMFDIISSNVTSITSKYAGEQNSFLTSAINNNASIIAKLATGDTNNLLNEVLDKNIGQVASMVGGNNASFYSNLILNNKELVGKALKGDFTALTTDLLVNNISLIGEKLPLGEAQKYAALLSNKEAIKGLLSGNTQSIISTLTQNGAQLFGDQIGNADVQKFAKLIANNRDFIQSTIDGDPKKMLNSLLSKDSNILGTALDAAQLGKFGEIVNTNSDIIVKLASGDTSNLLQDMLSKNISTLSGIVPNTSSNFYTDLIVKNQNLISKAVTGDFTSFTTDLLSNNTSLIGEILPSEEAKKYASLLANKDAIQGLLTGDTQSIVTTLTENGLTIFGDQIENVDIQKFAKLLGNNKDFLKNAMNGDTKNMLTSLLNKDANLLGIALDKKQLGEFGSILVDNQELLGKLASGDTSDVWQTALTNNVGKLVGSIGDETTSFYTNLVLKNKDNLSNIINGNTSGLVSLALANSTAFGSKISTEQAQKYSAILTDKTFISGFASFDMDTVLSHLNQNQSKLAGIDIQSFGLFISNNKDFITNINSGNIQNLVSSLLQFDRTIFGTELNFSQIGQFAQILGSKTNLISNLISDNSPNSVLKLWMSNQNLGLDELSVSKTSDLLLNNKEAVISLLKADKIQLANFLGNDEKTANILIENRSKINQLLGISEDEDFTILSKTQEELEVLAYRLSDTKEILNGIVKGDQTEIMTSYTTNNMKNEFGIDKNLFAQISKGLTAEQKTVSEVIVNSKINQMLLNDMIDLQFFDFGKDALSHKYDNVSLREKTFSQTTASILDPTLDPKDKSKFTINIFGKDSDKVLWQYINENNKTRIYDMSKTVVAIVKRLNKNFPYFNNK
ncbi:hypothetical protein [Soonwooa sp.]|uniref:hypothetical protein n=1 Tax=Soonwooa sp. TaxID=1938592 RepID=UPI0026084DDC|nr:hypothetical protein [Soonwooa sp.]